MYPPFVAWTLAASLYGASVSPLAARQTGYPACDLIPAAEVAKFLAVPTVLIDSLNTGKKEYTGVELCSWFVKLRDPRGVTVKLRRAKSPEETAILMSGARVDEEMTLDRAQAVPGLGDEAQYAGHPDGKGGTILVRKGASVVTITGSISKPTAIAMAKAALARL